ncbi:MAG: DUF11 domain-containing protein, partial [Archangium sp.]|nr:DUF11 domain-containing protein [Archangium sp.]
MRTLALRALVAWCCLLISACSEKTVEPLLQSDFVAKRGDALFTNAGFESGNLTGWTTMRGLNPGINFPVTQLSDLNITFDGGVANSFARTSASPVPLSGMTAGTGVPTYPRIGTYSAVVNESPQGDDRNVNSVRQSHQVLSSDIDPNDGKAHVRFAMAPALQAAGHVAAEQPYFYIEVRNTTRSTVLYQNFNYSAQPGLPWLTQGTGNDAVLYTDWQIYDVTAPDNGLTVGETVEIEVYGAGCEPGGHWGEVYVDGFGALPQSLWIQKSAPAFVNANSNMTYTFTVTNGTGFLAPNVVAEETIPQWTTFVSLSAPAGVTCTAPAVGGTGTVSCPLGSMNAGSAATFTVTVKTDTLAATPPSNRTGGTSGSASSGGSTSLTDTGSGWTNNQWVGWMVYVTYGTGAGQARVITANTSAALTVSPAWTTNPANGSIYMVLPPTVSNGNYSVRADTVSKIIGPMVQTAITPTTTYTDLSIVVDDNISVVDWGGSTTTVITVTNSGPNAVTAALVNDTFPSQLTAGNWTCTASAGSSCPASGSGNLVNVSVNLLVGGTATFSIPATVQAGSGVASFSNVASVATPVGTTDNTPSNNADSNYTDIGTVRMLSVSKSDAGTGLGTITSSPAGIACGPACVSADAGFVDGASITLTAVAQTGDRFVSWGGACSGTTYTCALTMTQARSATALFSGCGNGTLQTGEGCDDTNLDGGDGCSATCLVENTFNCNTTSPGATGSASCASGVCDTTNTPSPRCEAANTCGNGTREVGEGCDDGNTTNTDGCSSTCLVEVNFNCNTSSPGLTGTASCVATALCDTTNTPAPRCELLNSCGNGTRETGEGCDDGNTTNSDGCSSTCRVEVNSPCNSASPGLTGTASCVATAVCDSTHSPAPRCETANACGNGNREAGEGCDDGNATSGDGCSSACLVEAGSSCNTSSPGLTGTASCVATATCDTTHTPAARCEALNTCGNNVREAGEGCDDGNTSNSDGCSSGCRVEVNSACNSASPGLTGTASCVATAVCDSTLSTPTCELANACGNGNREAGEGCDDGNVLNNDGCTSGCLVEAGSSCNTSSPGLTGT